MKEKSSTNNIIWTVISIIFLIGLTAFGIYVAKELMRLIVALIGLGSTILVALVNNFLARERDRTLQIAKQKQENYTKLLGMIGRYIRNQQKNNDEFAGLHLLTWIYSNEKIINQTRIFMNAVRGDDKKNKREQLEKLLLLIREDIGLEEFKPDEKLLTDLITTTSEGTM